MKAESGPIKATSIAAASPRRTAAAAGMRRCGGTTRTGSTASGFGQRLRGGGTTMTRGARGNTMSRRRALAIFGAAGAGERAMLVTPVQAAATRENRRSRQQRFVHIQERTRRVLLTPQAGSYPAKEEGSMTRAPRTLSAPACRRNRRHLPHPHIRVRGLVTDEHDDGVMLTPPPAQPETV